MIPDSAGRILVVRLSARGDLVFASPLAGALRRRYPDAFIAWLAEERTADVIRHNPHLDEVIVWQRAAWKRLLRTGRWGALAHALVEFLGSLRARRFDVAIDVQGLLRSGVAAFLSGAPVRIGLRSREGSRCLMTQVVERGGDDRLIASEYRFLAERLGLATGPFPLEIPRGAEEADNAGRLLAGAGITNGFLAACPFTTRFHKHWFEDRWSSLIEQVRARLGVGVVLLGGPADRAAADRILDALPEPTPSAGPVVDLVGRTTLGEASAVVARCGVLVGVDTGLSHMAHAFDRPAVLLFGSNTPYLDPPGPRATILHSGRGCSPCRGRLVCDGRIDCMDDIAVGEVFAAVAARLEDRAAPPVPQKNRGTPACADGTGIGRAEVGAAG